MSQKPESIRQQRVARQIQKDLDEILRVKAPEISSGRMFTVTRVRVSPDLEYAKAYVSIFPSKTIEEDMERLRKATTTVRYELGKRVRHELRVVPELTFELDDSLDYVENIERLLQQDGE